MPESMRSAARPLVPGDVLMVQREMKDKKTRRPFVWRFFFVATNHRRGLVRGLVVGANENLKDKEITLGLQDERNTVHYLDESEWPDGVVAFRMSMILKGLIEDI